MPAKRRARYDPNAKAIERSLRACKPKACPRCHAAILVGPSEEDMYWTARVDAEPVDEWAEAMGRIDGRASYALTPHGQGLKLDFREGGKFGALHREPRPDVVLDHMCTRSLPLDGSEAVDLDPWSDL
jgi:hypothetical protein